MSRRHETGRRGRPRRWTRAVLVALAPALAAAPLLTSPAPAGALIVRVEGRAYGYQAAPGVIPPTGRKGSEGGSRAGKGAKGGDEPVTYHQGPVMPSNTNYALYWDPPAAGEFPAGYVSGIDRWFSDLAHDSGDVTNSDSVLTQYTDRFGHDAAYDSHFGGALYDTDPYPANGCTSAPVCLTDAQLRAEILAFVEADHLPVDLEHEYFLITPAGVESCMEEAGANCSDGTDHRTYCSYHSYVTSSSGGSLIYADIPYMVGDGCGYGEEHPSGSVAESAIAGGIAHEHSESVTDPELDAWFDGSYQEVADKCRTFTRSSEYGKALGKAPDKAKYNQVIDGDLYYYQQMFSDAADACEQREGQLVSVTKVHPSGGPAAGGTTVTVTGTGFTSPATVYFGSVPGSGTAVESSTSLRVASPAGAAGSTVSVVVETPAGESAPSKKARFKYKKQK